MMRKIKHQSLAGLFNIDTLKRLFSTLALSMCLMISACLSFQTVERPEENSLILRQTTKEEILKKYGKPNQRSESIRNFEPFITFIYAHVSGTAKPLHEYAQPTKTLALNFHKDKLVSYSFLANFANDHTDFDESKVKLVQKGKHTKTDVRNLLGTPAGKGVWPILASEDSLAWQYRYAHASYKNGTPPNIYDKEIAITFDEEGIVSDVKLTVKGKLN